MLSYRMRNTGMVSRETLGNVQCNKKICHAQFGMGKATLRFANISFFPTRDYPGFGKPNDLTMAHPRLAGLFCSFSNLTPGDKLKITKDMKIYRWKYIGLSFLAGIESVHPNGWFQDRWGPNPTVFLRLRTRIEGPQNLINTRPGWKKRVSYPHVVVAQNKHPKKYWFHIPPYLDDLPGQHGDFS